MRPYGDVAIALHVRNGDERTDRSVTHVSLFVCRRKLLCSASQRGPSFSGFAFAFRGLPPLLSANRFGYVLAAGQAGPVGPLCSVRNALGCLHCFPFIRRNDRQQICLPEDFSSRKLFLVDRAS